MAAFPCPYCGHACTPDERADVKLDRCPSCDGSLLIAYRYRLAASHGDISGGALYLARDDGFDDEVAVLFVAEPDDRAEVERFIEGNRLFADLGGRGLVKIYDVASPSERRAYVVMDWLDGGTLDKIVARRGPLDQPTLLMLVGDLLTGLSKAHRSMPAVVHGHIHPGKIGLRQSKQGGATAVLFGFEWAAQVNAQASRLAHSFIEDKREDLRTPAKDLRQLAVAFFYAATGEWIGEASLASQRERARANVPGPLGRLIDRMLGAGTDGYRSAVDAAIDLEQLMLGVDRWQAPTLVRPPELGAEPMGTAWRADEVEEVEEVEEVDEYEDDYEDDDEPARMTPTAAPARATVSAPPTSAPAGDAAQNWAAWAAQRQAEALAQQQQQQQQASSSNPGRTVALFIGVSIAFTTCIAGIIEDANDDPPPPPPRFEPLPQVNVEPIPLPEPPPLPELEPAPALEPEPARLSGVFRYQGKVTGPQDFAGLKLGSKCDVWIEPNDTSLNCRWYIDCGRPLRRIYGGGTVGFSRCEVDEDGRPLWAQDEEDDAADGAFVADLQASERMVGVSDRWTLPPVHVLISIEKGGPTTRRIPDVPLAPRLERDKIDLKIMLEEYPEIVPGVIADW